MGNLFQASGTVYERVGISLMKVSWKVGKSDSSVCKKGSKGLTDAFYDF